MTDEEWARSLCLRTTVTGQEALSRIKMVRRLIGDDEKADRWFAYIRNGAVDESAQLTMLLPAWVGWIDWNKVP